jgi:hypothetical protein
MLVLIWTCLTNDEYLVIQGELEHCCVKRLYGCTNKNRAIVQMTRHERQETCLLHAKRAAQQPLTHPHLVDFAESDPLPYTNIEMHHHISESRRHYQDAFVMCCKYPNDPAMKVGLCMFLKTSGEFIL